MYRHVRGFGVLIHKVAKLRTAQDVRDGIDEQPESVWISSVKHSAAVQPPESGATPTRRDAAPGLEAARGPSRRP